MLDWTFPYASRRAPVFAENVVATSQPLATQAAIEIMHQGGNAIDAALCAAITLTVVEPSMNGLGSDAFAIIWDGQALHGINGSGRAPKEWSPKRFAGARKMPTLGWDSVTVPGAISVWMALSERFGNQKFEKLFNRAIYYARHGFQVGHKTAVHWEAATRRYGEFQNFRTHFMSDGKAPNTGTRVTRPNMADTLELIAESHGEAFYRGSLALAIAANAEELGGAMRLDDLAEHSPEWIAPIAQNYRHVTLHEIPPNSQGLAAQIALAILNHFDLPGLPPNGEQAVHLQVEAMKIAIRAAFEHLGDPRGMTISAEALLDPESIKLAAMTIGQNASPLPPARLPTSKDTVYLTTADAEGRMVSFIQSNYQGFGSGIVVPETGIAMQNRGSGFSLQKDHPNEVAGGKRPFHTIIPGFITEMGEPRMSFGVMGGHMQHQGQVQMVHRIFDLNENPQTASDAPRWHITPEYKLALEPGFDVQVASNLAKRGHEVIMIEDNTDLFGGAQLIYRLPQGYCAASDHRKEGLAAGF